MAKAGSRKMEKSKITNKKIYDIVGEVVGDDAVKIVEFLKDRKNISEFKIAEKTNTEIHHIRNVLYRLHNQHLVTYKRKKDRQKGWYISYWTFNKKRVKDLITHLKAQKISRFKERLEKEERNRGFFFLCKNACVRMDFDQATEYEFKCPECGTLLDQHDNTKTIESLREKIRELEGLTE
jgi:transcription initiation factor TFIIE subunit alpha